MSDDANAGALQSEVLPLIFGDAGPEAEPALVLLNDAGGSGRSGVLSDVVAQHPGISVVNERDLQLWTSGALVSPSLAPDAAAHVQAAIAYALTNRRSALLEGSAFTPAMLRAAAAFAAAGFTTRVVVAAVRPAEAFLADASRYSQAASTGRRMTLTDVRQSVQSARNLLRAAAEGSIERLTVLSRDGRVEYDARAGDLSAAEAASGLEAALTRRLTSLQAAQWISELRRITEYAQSARDRPRELTVRLIELHELAVQEIVPELSIPTRSAVASLLEQRSAAALSILRRDLATPRSRDDLAAPVIPVSTGPDRGLGR